MAKTKFDEMMDRLPSNINETDVLRYTSKKVLAALLELLIHSKARESRVIYCQNSRLSKLAGVGSDELRPAIDQLIDYELITRKVGTCEGDASEYTINFKKLKEPLIEKTFDDLYGEFMEETESSEMPISTTTTTTITTSNTTSTTITTSNPILTSTSSQEQVQLEEPARPKNYKELIDYFKRRMEIVCKDKTIDELNEIQESLKDELDEFNEITDYQNIYIYLITPSMDKKRERLLVKALEEGSANSRIPVLTESQATALNEDVSQASPVKKTYSSTEAESTPAEGHPIPTEKEQFDEWYKVIRPFRREIEEAVTLEQMSGIKDRALQAMNDYLDAHTYTSSEVFETMKKSVVMAYDYKLKKLTSQSVSLPLTHKSPLAS